MAGEKDDLSLKALGGFTGTQSYYKVLGSNVTDGIHYIMENGYSWFVTDFLAVVATNTNKLKEQEFLSIKLKLKEDKTAQMSVEDGNGKVLYTQEYSFTDAQVELTLYYCDGVLMLSQEY